MTGNGHEDGNDKTDLPTSIGRGAQKFHRDEILDFGTSRCGHGESDGPEGQSGGNEAAGQIGFAEQVNRQRIDGKCDYEDADSAIGQNCTGGNNG